MSWLFFALLAYFLLAIAAMIDKILLTRDIPHPSVYAFYISALNILALLLIPFGFTVMPWDWIGISLLSGGFLTLGLLLFFYSMKENDATKVIPFIGGATPILTILFTALLLDERLLPLQLAAFVILVMAAVLISVDVDPGRQSTRIVRLWHLLLASVFFSASYALSKYVLDAQPFISVFVWTRLGSFIIGVLLLVVPIFRSQIFSSFQRSARVSSHAMPLFAFGQFAGAAGVFSQYYAIALGSVSLVNALQGLQQVFILVLAGLLQYFNPTLLTERFTPKILAQKISAILLILIGLVLLAFT